MSTYFPKEGEIARRWYVVNAEGQPLGRLAARVARVLTGKNNPRYTPFIDTGDHVVVVNAAKVRLTGLKAEKKVYRRYTGYPGGLREEQFSKRLSRKPELIVQEAIVGMLPHTKLGRAMAKKLKVYRGDKHPHQAQKPEVLALMPQQ
ncbi:MAG: 50S ribosomal protein L13 [Acidobacteriales bacterium]|nr:50S ribosomal protein L13 [Terriglobales bacterium]